MKKLFFLLCSIVAGSLVLNSCKDTMTYADYVNDEKAQIKKWINENPYNIDFGQILTKDEEWLNNVTKSILNDSVHPSKLIELNQWYTLDESYFKRLYFCVHSWGDDGVTDYNDEEQLKKAMRSRKKFYTGQDAMVRFDSLFVLNLFDYDGDPTEADKLDNFDPLSYMIIYNWNSNYYANSYYSYYYSSGSSYECTSGGVGFPVRFLWDGGEVSIICPFSIVETSLASYYYTLYYGNIKYTKPNFLPQ